MRFLLAGVLVGVIAMVVGVGLGVTLEADDAEDFIRGGVLIILPLGVVKQLVVNYLPYLEFCFVL